MGRGLSPQATTSYAPPILSRGKARAAAAERGAAEHGAGQPPQNRLELAQAALYHISEATQIAEDLDELYRHIHAAVAELMPALNFYIALYDERTDLLTYPYHVDGTEPMPPPHRPGRSLTGYVLRSGRALLASQDVFDRMLLAGEVELVGEPSYDWMGVPLRARRAIIGVMVVQTYTPDVRYNQSHLELLEFVSTQVGMAIERKRDQDALRASEERYRMLFEHAPVGILTISPQGYPRQVNPLALQLLGSPSLEATRALNIFESDALQRCGFALHFRRCLDTGQRVEAECPYTSRWGKELFVHYYLEPLHGPDGRVSQVQVQIEDITARKQAEEQAGRLHLENLRLLERMQAQNLALVEAYEATIEGWSRALEMRDKETKGHSERVTRLSLELGGRVGLSAAELVDLRRGVLLHDIGKMVTPDAILLKPGPLNAEEWKVMRQHPVYAYQMLRDIPFLERALDIPWAHHENYDGTGYPRGLEGEAIPYGARIFALVDVWDALTSDRPYRPAWPAEKSLAFIAAQSGKRFDPRLTAEFLKMMAEE